MTAERFYVYYRVSARKHGRAGFRLLDQRRAVAEFLGAGDWVIMGEFTELETGRVSGRPQLILAIDACQNHSARLLIARMEALSNDLHFLRRLQESGVHFFAADSRDVTRSFLPHMIEDAENAVKLLRRRTRPPPHASRRGVRLHSYRDPANGEGGRQVTAERARERALQLKAVIDELHGAGITSLSDIARQLTARQVRTATHHGKWSASQVVRIIRRIKAVTSSEPEPPRCGSL